MKKLTAPVLQHVPHGFLSRAPAAARIALGLGRSGAARLIGRGDEADERLGEVLLDELDRLKGMAMKVGQILSYMDVGLPEPVTARLHELQRGVRPLPAAVIRALVAERLGQPVETLFATFDDEAIAAASIGQVHRARTHAGEPVAVKVRYPGIEASFDADFRQLGSFGRVASTFSAVDGRALVEELHARVREETDYAREAAWQRRFAALFAEDADIHVPEVHGALSVEGVLTTTFCEGERFEALVATAGPAERERAAQALLRFAMIPLFSRRMLHADPHPGNQLWQPGGRLVALDFGCVRAFDASFLDAYRAFCAAILDEDRARFVDGAIALGLAPRPEAIDFEAMWRMYRWLFEPLWQPRFTFTTAWWRAGRAFTSPTAPNARQQGFPPAWIWLQRVQWGLWALLVRLGARGDFGTPYRAMLALPTDVDDPSSGATAGPETEPAPSARAQARLPDAGEPAPRQGAPANA